MKRVLSVLFSLLLVCGTFIFSLAAETDDCVISNPYAEIDWNTIGQYKTALHTHTNASDGDHTLKESLQRHMETGFDIVAVTDHGTVDYGWERDSSNRLIKTALNLFGRSEGDVVPIGSEGTFENGVGYTYITGLNGDDFLKTDNGRTILRLPFGIENNAVSVNAHVTSWFADYHDNTVTGYADAMRGVNAAGGLCVINHPGEYTKARYELHSEDAYDESNAAYAYYINKFASYIETCPACIGIDMNSKGDNRTRFDRILWDKLLTRFSKTGRNVFAVASSDAHQLDVIDTGFSVLLLPALSSSAAKQALQNGTFFAASHCLGNMDELYEIAAALKTLYGADNRTFQNVLSAADRMAQRIADIESGVLEADEDIGITYSVLNKDGYTTADSFPSIAGVSVSDEENTITFSTEDAMLVRFIFDGKTIATLRAGEATLDLDDYKDVLGEYVRAEVFGEGGMLYTQPFLLNAEENAAVGGKVTRGLFADLGTFDFLIAEVHRWLRIGRLFFKTLFQ